MTPRRGWTSQDLPVLDQDASLWRAQDAANLLGPPTLTPPEVRRLIILFGIRPVGRARTRTAGRAARLYRAADLIEAYDALQRRSAART